MAGHTIVSELAVERAQQRLAEHLSPTPLLPLAVDSPGLDLWLKLENLQPIGSFKIRGALNAMLTAAENGVTPQGVYTASAGNMAQGVAWAARLLGWPATVVLPHTAPTAKVAAVERLGAEIVKLPWREWWSVIIERRYGPLEKYHFVHPFDDPDVIAGNAGIGVEILDQRSAEPDAVVVPFGGGGLVCGVAAGLRTRSAKTRVYACECDAAAPLAAAFAHDEPTSVSRRQSFVDGMGSERVSDSMWPRLKDSVAESLVVSESDIAAAMRLLASRSHVIAEGAGAASVATASSGAAGSGYVVCVVSGGTVDPSLFSAILQDAHVTPLETNR